MYFLDLKELKISENDQFQSTGCRVKLSEALDCSIGDLRNAVQRGIAASSMFDGLSENTPVNFVIDVDVTDGFYNAQDQDEIDGFFYTIINIASAEFFDALIKKEGSRPRERRLDVPDNLRGMRANLGLIKKAINHATQVDVFNLTIQMNGYVYVMVFDAEGVELTTDEVN